MKRLAMFGLIVLCAVGMVWSSKRLTPSRADAGLAEMRYAAVADADRARIRQHLLRVEQTLTARDVSGLTAAQRAARAGHIAALREYRQAGVFPHNHDQAVRTPYFRDAHGTLCAMAWLIARSGGEELVARVEASSNNAYIRELAGDQQLLDWLNHNGLSVEEAALIQPTYGPADESVDGTYARVSLGLAAAQGAVITWNVLAMPPRSFWPGATAMVLGASSFTIGAASEWDDDVREMAPVNIVLGAATFTLGLVNTVRAWNNPRRNSRSTEGAPQSSRWSPILAPRLDGSSALGVALRF